MTGGKCAPKEHHSWMIPSTASAFGFRLPADRSAKGALSALLLLAALGACGGAAQEPPPRHRDGCEYHVESPAGMRLRYPPGGEPRDPRANGRFPQQPFHMGD